MHKLQTNRYIVRPTSNNLGVTTYLQSLDTILTMHTCNYKLQYRLRHMFYTYCHTRNLQTRNRSLNFQSKPHFLFSQQTQLKRFSKDMNRLTRLRQVLAFSHLDSEGILQSFTSPNVLAQSKVQTRDKKKAL